MTRRKRHTPAEILAKLTEASELAAMGKTQSEIGRALGISVMTYHRWRKLLARPRPITQAAIPITSALDHWNWESSIQATRVAELQLENLMLRRLVPDLLLEKAILEEAASQRRSSGRLSQRSLAQGA